MNPSKTKRALLTVTCAVTLITSFGSASAQTPDVDNYPDRPIRWLVPFAAGGGTDNVARTVSEAMTRHLKGSNFVIDNKPGAMTTIAMTQLVRSKPDGYTIASATDSLAVNSHIIPKLAYTLSEIKPISVFVKSPMLLVTPNNIQAKNIDELFSHLKNNQTKLSYGSWGVASSPHLAMEYMSERLGIRMTHVPYNGAAPAVLALLSGELNVMWADFATVLPYVKDGKVKAWAISTKQTSAMLPEIKPLAEQGMADFDLFAWNGLTAPAGTPADVVEKLAIAANKAITDPVVSQKLKNLGFFVWGSTPAEFDTLMKNESLRSKKIIESRNIRIE